jgi:hypothetical protein
MIVQAEKLHFYWLCGTSMYSKVLGLHQNEMYRRNIYRIFNGSWKRVDSYKTSHAVWGQACFARSISLIQMGFCLDTVHALSRSLQTLSQPLKPLSRPPGTLMASKSPLMTFKKCFFKKINEQKNIYFEEKLARSHNWVFVKVHDSASKGHESVRRDSKRNCIIRESTIRDLEIVAVGWECL